MVNQQEFESQTIHQILLIWPSPTFKTAGYLVKLFTASLFLLLTDKLYITLKLVKL